MKWESMDIFIEDVERDKIARTSAMENSIRNGIAATIETVRQSKNFSIRRLAHEMETSVSQVQRLLNKHEGGSLTLKTIVRAADALDLDIDVELHASHCVTTAFVEFKSLSASGGIAQWLPTSGYYDPVVHSCRDFKMDAPSMMPLFTQIKGFDDRTIGSFTMMKR